MYYKYKMNTILQASADMQLINNNNIIQDTSIKAIYDGDDLNISALNNDNIVYVRLNNDEIMKLLSIPANSSTLEQRLKKDFPIRRKKNTRKRRKYRKTPYRLSKKI